jgi:hypothetical protein
MASLVSLIRILKVQNYSVIIITLSSMALRDQIRWLRGSSWEKRKGRIVKRACLHLLSCCPSQMTKLNRLGHPCPTCSVSCQWFANNNRWNSNPTKTYIQVTMRATLLHLYLKSHHLHLINNGGTLWLKLPRKEVRFTAAHKQRSISHIKIWSDMIKKVRSRMAVTHAWLSGLISWAWQTYLPICQEFLRLTWQ